MVLDKWTALVGIVLIASVLIFLSLAQASPTETPSTLERVVTGGKITACFIAYPPLVVKDPNSGRLSGEMIDAFEYIASAARLDVQYVESSWGTFIAALQSGRCDVVVTGLFNKIERAKSVSFTRPMFYMGNGVLVRANETRFRAVSDFNRSGIQIAVISGEVGHLYAQSHLDAAELVVLPGSDISLALQQVSSGRADAAFTDGWTIEQYAQAHPETMDFRIINASATYGMNPVAWAVRSDDAALLTFFNNAFDELEANGKFLEWEARDGLHWYRQPFRLERS